MSKHNKYNQYRVFYKSAQWKRGRNLYFETRLGAFEYADLCFKSLSHGLIRVYDLSDDTLLLSHGF